MPSGLKLFPLSLIIFRRRKRPSLSAVISLYGWLTVVGGGGEYGHTHNMTRSQIEHFTVVCLVNWVLNGSEA